MDSAFATLNKPLYEVVRDNLQAWKDIGANSVVLDWIEHGVLFNVTKPVPNFF